MHPADSLREELRSLFQFAPPQQLQRSLLYVFLDFLQQDKEFLPDNLDKITADIYFLLNFLQQAEDVGAGK